METVDHGLFETLRTLRKSIADSENVPPYIIFPDFALKEMATFFPQSTDNMAKIKGVGNVKLERYGHKFLEAVTNYCRQNNIEEREISRKVSLPREPDTRRKTLELIQQDMSLDEIAKKRGVVQSTIVSHVEKLILSGETININRFVSQERQEAICCCMQNLKTQKLTLLKENLGDGYSYDEIRLVRAQMNASKTTIR